MTKIEKDVQKFQRAMALLQRVMHDEQLVEGTPYYQGFLAVGTMAYLPDNVGLSQEQMEETWEYIVSRPGLFLPIIDALGMVTERGQLRLHDTVFEPKK